MDVGCALEAFIRIYIMYFFGRSGRDINDNLILERRNGSGASVKGFNLEGNIAPHKKINVQFGFTYQQSRYKKRNNGANRSKPENYVSFARHLWFSGHGL